MPTEQYIYRAVTKLTPRESESVLRCGLANKGTVLIKAILTARLLTSWIEDTWKQRQ
jgi:hypothetical protein